MYQLKGWYPGVTQALIKTGESASDRVASEDDATGSLSVEDKETLAKETVTVASEVLQEKESKISSEVDSIALDDNTEETASVISLGSGSRKS